MTLTPIQERILGLLLQGKTQKEVADEINMSREMVAFYIGQACRSNDRTTIQLAADYQQMLSAKPHT